MASTAAGKAVQTARPNEQPHVQMFFHEDSCALQSDPSKTGVVLVDGQRAYIEADAIEFDESMSPLQRRNFLDTGVLPRHYVLVMFADVTIGARICAETKLLLRDRALSFGDVVKRRPNDQMSGTVIQTAVTCDLIPSFSSVPSSTNPTLPPSHASFAPDHGNREALWGVPGHELKLSWDYREGDFVLHKGWVGIMEDVSDDVVVRLNNGSVVAVEDPEELEIPLLETQTREPSVEAEDAADSKAPDGKSRSRRTGEAARGPTLGPGRSRSMPAARLSPGQFVSTKKGNLRRGVWIYGAYDPNVPPFGLVVEVRTVMIWVRWLCANVMTASQSRPSLPAPPETIEPHELERGELRVYDRGSSPLTEASDHACGFRRGEDLQLGDYVRFRDLSGATMKYDGSTRDAQGRPQGRLVRIPRAASLGYDVNTFCVAETRSQATVQWQDQTITTEASTDLVPYLNVDDRDVWPGELVIARMEDPAPTAGLLATDDPSTSAEAISRPGRVAVVQSVDAVERIAQVRWFVDAQIELAGPGYSLLLPGAQFGSLREEASEVSIYEIQAVPALARRRGDFVVVGGEASEGVEEASKKADWFGEVVDVGTDGLITVRLGALDKVRDLTLPLDKMTVIYGDDESDGDDGFEGSESESLEDQDWHGSEDIIEETVEYEGGERLEGDGSDDMWLTDASSVGENSDVSMTDIDEARPERAPSPGLASSLDPSMSAPVNLETEHPPKFLVLDDPPPSDHAFLKQSEGTSQLRRIQKEHKVLESSLPDGIWVRTWESRLDLLRVLIIGPEKTPYALVPFVFDFQFGSEFPFQPPTASFHSWTNGFGRINPNLYEDGKVCLSLLGTWPADVTREGWTSSGSTMLQVLVSLMGLVLVKEPYYNEAGFEILVGTDESRIASAQYSERAYLLGQSFVIHALMHP
ncbi:MAG: hypothetical protein M1838_003424, partial [Thelocarpon superellum]